MSAWRDFITLHHELLLAVEFPPGLWAEERAFAYFLMHGAAPDGAPLAREALRTPDPDLIELAARYVAGFGDPGVALFDHDTNREVAARAIQLAEMGRTDRALYPLPGAPRAVLEVTGLGPFYVRFLGSRAGPCELELSSAFGIVDRDGPTERYPPPARHAGDWRGAVLEALVGAKVERVGYDASGTLQVSFGDGRRLEVEAPTPGSWRWTSASLVVDSGRARREGSTNYRRAL